MWDRIYDIWIGDEDAELRNMIDEFRMDYALNRKFMVALDLIESAVANWDYTEAETLFQEYAPAEMDYYDKRLFTTLLRDANYGI